MDTGEFNLGQVKGEVNCNHLYKVARTDAVNVFSRCERHDESLSRETNLVGHKNPNYDNHEEHFFANKLNPENVDHSEVFKDVSTDECNTKQIKNENEIDIFYDDIKREIGEEKPSELPKFCEVCHKSFSGEIELINSKNNRLDCSCQKQNYSINQGYEDVKQPSFILATGFGLKLPIVQDKTISQDKHDNKQVSLAESQKDLGFSLKDVKKLAPNNIPVDLEPQMTSGGLKTHEMNHTKEKPFHCKICSKTFIMNSSNLKIHQRIHAGVKPFQCKICSKYMSSLQNLKVHERIHTGEKPYVCQICSKSFRNLQNLKMHERIHTGETPFQCKICSKYFSYMHNLIIHKRIHTGETPFHCKICSKYFISSQILKDHKRIHTELKPFCQICSKYFSSFHNLKVHGSIHTGEKPYHCKICSKSFRTIQNMKIHERTHTVKKP